MNSPEALTYLLFSGGTFAALYLIYLGLFKRDTFFQTNRIYLVAIVPVSLLLPLLTIGGGGNATQQFAAMLPTISIDTTVQTTSGFPWAMIFLFITSLFVARMAVRMIRLVFVLRQVKRGQEPAIAPFSFFYFVYIPSHIDANSYAAIERHEQVHARQWHSADILFYELYCALFWWNPLSWVALKSVKTNHEFIADKIASKENTRNYSTVLIAQVLGVNCSALANNFSNEPIIKRRIKMMKTQKSKRWTAVRYTAVLPVLFTLILLGGNVQLNATVAQETVPAHGEDEKVYEEVDLMPEFKGGMEGLIEFLSNEIKYPESAEKDNAEGTVYVQFVVNKEGKVTDVALKQGTHDALDKTALQAVQGMPDWTPGEHEGEKVNVQMILPIKFKLPAEEE